MKQVFPAVKAVVKKNGQFLVLKQKIQDKEIWDFPGGEVIHGESPYTTLKREVKEKTDLEIEPVKMLGLWWFFRGDGAQIVCTTFLCRANTYEVDLTKNPTKKKEPIKEFKWVTKKEFLSDKYQVGHESLKVFVNNYL